LADGYGRPVAFALTPGNVADITMAIPLLTYAYMGYVRPKRLLADKAYDANSLRRWLKQRRVRAIIPSTATRTKPFALDRKTYRRRNLIERLFCKLKNWRRIATRYDRLAANYLAAIMLSSIVIAWT
jgi:transposase